MQGAPKFGTFVLPPDLLFVVSSENTDFPKKLFKKIFSVKFVIKKVTVIFGVR